MVLGQEARKHTCGLYFRGWTCKLCNKKIHLWLRLDMRKSADITSGKRRRDVVQVWGITMNICWNALFFFTIITASKSYTVGLFYLFILKRILLWFWTPRLSRQSIRSSQFMAINPGRENLLMLGYGAVFSVYWAVLGFFIVQGFVSADDRGHCSSAVHAKKRQHRLLRFFFLPPIRLRSNADRSIFSDFSVRMPCCLWQRGSSGLKYDCL